MSGWQLYPNHVWLADGDHAVLLLVMELAERRVLGVTVTQEPEASAALLARLVDTHGCPSMLCSIWDPLFEDLNAAAREAVRRSGCPKPVGVIDPDDFFWALEIGNAATRALRDSNPATLEDAVIALETWLHAPSRTSAGTGAAQRLGSVTIDAHPCEGPGSDPQDLLPDDRAWGSRPPPPGPS